MSVRRTRAQIIADRRRIVEHFSHAEIGRSPEDGARFFRKPEDWMRPADLDALVKSGVLDRQVRREYDKQTGWRVNGLFGGAGVMVRHRAHYRLVEDPEVTAAHQPAAKARWDESLRRAGEILDAREGQA